MSRAFSFFALLAALVLTGCGKAPVVVGTGTRYKELRIVEDQEWVKAWRCASTVTENWRLKYDGHSQLLLGRAAESGLDSISLSNVLQVALLDAPREKRAYVPFASYRLEWKGEPVWLIDLAWEFGDGARGLPHVCSYIINAQDYRQLSFVTCQ